MAAIPVDQASWWMNHPITDFVPVSPNNLPADMRARFSPLFNAINQAAKNARETALRDRDSNRCPMHFRQQSFMTWYHAHKAQEYLKGTVPAVLQELMETIDGLNEDLNEEVSSNFPYLQIIY